GNGLGVTDKFELSAVFRIDVTVQTGQLGADNLTIDNSQGVIYTPDVITFRGNGAAVATMTITGQPGDVFYNSSQPPATSDVVTLRAAGGGFMVVVYENVTAFNAIPDPQALPSLLKTLGDGLKTIGEAFQRAIDSQFVEQNLPVVGKLLGDILNGVMFSQAA